MQSEARALAESGQNEEAEKAFLDICRIDPYFPESRLDLAKFYFTTGRADTAVAVIKEGLKLVPGNELLLSALNSIQKGGGEK